jgi:hypothetical protein
MRPYSLWQNGCGDNAIRRLAAEVGRIDRLVRVEAADKGMENGELPEFCRWLLDRAEKLKIADSVPRAILQGRDLISIGMKPGPDFGVLLAKAYEAQLDGLFSDHDGAMRYLARERQQDESGGH